MLMKHLLTGFHCLMALVVTSLGLWWASTVSQPEAAVLVAAGAIMFPVFIATRVAWSAGYAAGRKAFVQNSFHFSPREILDEDGPF